VEANPASTTAHGALTSAHGGRLRCVVVTPETTVSETTSDFVALPLFDGEIGIAPGHSAMIGRLGYGEMRLKNGNATERLYVDGGFVQVVDNQVSVLTNRALPVTALDMHVAAEHLSAARKRPSNTPELMAIRDRLELQARAQLRAARRTR
jgi:F-type H+-transporting ATPase subunit epsilon